MNKTIAIKIILFFIVTGIFAQNKEKVYVVGENAYYIESRTEPDFNITVVDVFATLWVNGDPQRISRNARILDLYLFDNDVYMVGDIGIANERRATIWKNNIPQTLINSVSTAYSIFVSNNNVYVSGYAQQDTNDEKATLWINGNPHTLHTEGSSIRSIANSVFVFNDDIYVTGDIFLDGNWKAILWKNNVPQTLSHNNKSHASSVFVYNNDVYVTGYVQLDTGDQQATLWKNGIPLTLDYNDGRSSRAESLFVYEDNIYVVGVVGRRDLSFNTRAAIWKNGVLQILRNSESTANSVFVFSDNVYVAGFVGRGHGRRATLWVNNILQSLSNEHSSDANAVFVK